VARYSIGLDFGTESVRAVVVDTADGRVAGQASANYEHGVIEKTLPNGIGGKLPAGYALQDPLDWLHGAGEACKAALGSGGVLAEEVVGIGVDFTSCTMLATRANGMPLCLLAEFRRMPLAWPKLWKHHGARGQADRINRVARERGEAWLARYGGVVSLEWFFPKVLETLQEAPEAYDAAQVWLEAGDWLVWQLTSGPFPRCRTEDLVRSTCQAGYKAMWNAKTGYPSRAFFEAVHPGLADVVAEKMPGRLLAPGARAGVLTKEAAGLLGLKAGTPVATAIIDAHAGVPGSGVADGSTIVLVMGTSSCHMMNARVERLVPGICGVVEEGILPGYFGYETGQASVGDAFAWVTRTLGVSHEEMNEKAARLGPGSGGVLALDWLNGCRTPLMDGQRSGAFVGITLDTRPEQLYRAMLEATAMGLKWIVETMREAGVTVERFVAGGGLPAKSPLLMQICADVLGAEIHLAASEQSVAVGAAILGCVAAGSRATIEEAITAMARVREDLVYRPGAGREKYAELYRLYRELAGDEVMGGVMERLRGMHG
jgi:L-ribulokinase